MTKRDNFELRFFLKSLRVMVEGGLPEARAVSRLAEYTPEPGYARYLTAARADLEAGRTLSEALFGRPHPFPAGMAHGLADGEKPAPLVETLTSLEDRYELTSAAPGLAGGVLSTAGHFLPVAVAAAVSLFLLIIIVPGFQSMYAEFGSAMPVPTMVMFNLSDLVRGYWPVLILAGLALAWLLHVVLQRYALRGPGLHFAFSLIGRRLAGGADLGEALVWAARAVDHPRLSGQLKLVAQGLANGLGVAEAFRQSPFFPSFVPDVLAAGEARGDLGPALGDIVYVFSGRGVAGRSIAVLAALIFLVCFLITALFALYLPMFQMAGAVG